MHGAGWTGAEPRETAARLCAQGKFAEASATLSSGMGGGPEDAPLLHDLAHIRLRQRDAAGAVSLLESAVAIEPSQGVYRFALAAARTAFQQANLSPEACCELARIALLHGDLATGLPLMEARRELRGFATPAVAPAWRRGDRIPRRLLIVPEEGMSETILMSRFLPVLAARCDYLTMVVQRPLLRLFTEAFPGVLVREDVGPSTYDAWCPVISLPYLLGIERLEQVATTPWLHLPAGETPDRPLRIGINWAGNPEHHHDAPCSPSLDSLALLLQVPEVEWVSLHRGSREDDALRYRLPTPLAAARDFADTAGVLAGLDLVISAETALAHLSAAMGVPTVVLGSRDPDWRWHGWYRDVTVCRQTTDGDWAPVVQEVLHIVHTRMSRVRPASFEEVCAA